MKTILVFCVVGAHCILALSSDEEWRLFKTKYGKVYKEAEEERLSAMKFTSSSVQKVPGSGPTYKSIWTERTKQIRRHNEAADRGRYSYHRSMNQFGDMGDCGSGYAFSATGSLERQFTLKTGNLTVLSVQNLLDCSTKQGNFGCMGGTMAKCFEYVADNNGIDSRSSYPYEGRDGQCRFNRSGVVGTDIGHANIQSGNEAALQRAVADVGPIATAIDASQFSFRTYTSGVYDDPKCSSTRLDHGILLVGYGHDKSSGKDYWILKNTYGPGWGMDGYIFMARNHGNRCGELPHFIIGLKWLL